MKPNKILLFLCTFSVLFASAQQTKLSPKLAFLLDKETNPLKTISVLVKGDIPFIKEEVMHMGGSFKFTAGNIASVIVSTQALRTLANDPHVFRIEEGKVRLQQMNDHMLINNKVDKVHQGISPLTQGYDGTGVIVGMIDTGIDFTHPDFVDAAGNSRVLWIWDHVLPTATNSPHPYNYGQQFSNFDINSGNAIAHVDQTAHGTHVTGIATSNGRGGVAFTGVAPKADIIAVSMDLTLDGDQFLSSVADAIDYIFNKADSLGKPCVINISLGTYLGSHDGKDLSTQAIDNMIYAKNGRAVVAAAGNAGGVAFHLQHQLVNDSLFTWFHYSGTPITIECWGDTANISNLQFTLGADQATPAFADTAQLSWTTPYSNLGIVKTDTLKTYNGSRVAIIQSYKQVVGNQYSITYTITPDSTNYYYRLMSKGTGKFDCWSFDIVTTGLPNGTAYPNITMYKFPDVLQTICSGFQCSDKVLTVAQYINRNSYVDVNGTTQTFPTTVGALAASSSWGPTRDGRIKPDITSTGEVTLSALKLSSQAFFLANQPYKLAQGGIHIRDGGTSSAAPVVTGVIALYLQKNPTATLSDIRDRVMYCSVQDNFTGAVQNTHWGHGKLDAFGVMIGCSVLGVNQIDANSFSVYPNPVKNKVTIQLTAQNNPVAISIYNTLGEEVKSLEIASGKNQLTIDRDDLPAGLYMICLHEENKTITQRIVFE